MIFLKIAKFKKFLKILKASKFKLILKRIIIKNSVLIFEFHYDKDTRKDSITVSFHFTIRHSN